MGYDGDLGVARVETTTFQDSCILHCLIVTEMFSKELKCLPYYELSNVNMNNVGSFETSVSIQNSTRYQFKKFVILI
jgi:hypothetical protein